jgi:hypothetical protein
MHIPYPCSDADYNVLRLRCPENVLVFAILNEGERMENRRMPSLTTTTAIMAFLSVAALPGWAFQGQEPGAVPGVAKPKTQAPKADATKTDASSDRKWTAIDENSITVIRGLAVTAADVTKLDDALKGLRTKTTFSASVGQVVKLLNDSGLNTAFDSLTDQDSGPHLLIHHLETPKGATDASEVTARWYLYRKDIGWSEVTGKRLYGVSTLHVLTVAGPVEDSRLRDRFAALQIKAVIKKKLPANVQNFLAVLRLTGFGAETGIAPTFMYGFGTMSDIDIPSDVTVNAYELNPANKSEGQAIGKGVLIDNEGRYWWDISLGFPVKEVNDLEYVQTGNLIQTRKVDKSTAFALADLYFRSIDIKNPGKTWNPSLVTGAGLKGKLRERLLLGISSNLPPIQRWSFTRSGWYQFFRPYAGVQFLSTQRPVDNPMPGAPQFEPRTVRKLAIGLNIPVKSSIERLADPPKKASEPEKKPEPAAAKPTAPKPTAPK